MDIKIHLSIFMVKIAFSIEQQQHATHAVHAPKQLNHLQNLDLKRRQFFVIEADIVP